MSRSHTAFVPAPLPGVDAPRTGSEADAAHAAGFAAGFAAGMRAAAEQAEADRTVLRVAHDRGEARRDAEVAHAVDALAAAADALDARVAPVVAQAQGAVHDAALAIAEAVIAREVRPGPDSSRALLERALAVPEGYAPARVRMHPADLSQVSHALEEGTATLPSGVDLLPDPRLTPGDALTEYQDGALDLRVGAALDRARAALTGEDQA